MKYHRFPDVPADLQLWADRFNRDHPWTPHERLHRKYGWRVTH